MGIPYFYRWLVRKYPKITVEAQEDDDCSGPNPNGIEFDNLYVDMNYFVHSCFHPDDELEPPASYDVVFVSLFSYLDRIFSVVRPRKVVYMAVDGVPPRAKMNAERSTRFHKWKDEKTAVEVEERLRAEFEISGKRLLPKVQPLDSNVITPGTKFMEELTQALHEYICRIMKSNEEWSNIKVILSDSNVPGEGEHKIMAFIRSQRNAPGYDFNTKHCIVGMDADLILLALASHEVHVSILRVDVLFLEKNENFNVHVKAVSVNDGINTAAIRDFSKVPFQFLHVWILREYLQLDLQINDANQEADFERVIDDFVFMSFFLGNDFFPPLPNLDMHEKAMDLLMAIYKNKFNDMGGYLVDTSAVIDKKDCLRIDSVEIFLHSLGLYEENIFQKRSELKEYRLEKFQSNQLNQQRKLWTGDKAASSEWLGCCLVSELNERSFFQSKCNLTVEASQNMMQLRRTKKEKMRELTDLWKDGPKEVDELKLGAPGWKQRYYNLKFSINECEMGRIHSEVVKSYMEGLYWMMHYYYSGVCSWTWSYDQKHSPLASDFKDLKSHKINFSLGKPYKPFDQLMSVLPPSSSHALPESYGLLMTSDESSLKDFYPADYEFDIEGKRFTWQCDVILPPIDEKLLFAATRELEKALKLDEMWRNRESLDKIYVAGSSDLGRHISSCYKLWLDLEVKIPQKTNVYRIARDLSGYIRFRDDSELQSDRPCLWTEHGGRVIYVFFQLPPNTCHHVPGGPGKSLHLPEKVISEWDVEEVTLWHEEHLFYKNRETARSVVEGLPINELRYMVEGNNAPISARLEPNRASVPFNSRSDRAQHWRRQP